MFRKQRRHLKDIATLAVGLGVYAIRDRVIQSVKRKVGQLIYQNQPCHQTKQQNHFQETQEQVRQYDELENQMTCPISLQIMRQPCILGTCGHTFERKHITKWVSQNEKCPICQLPSSLYEIKPNYQLKEVIVQYQANKKHLQSTK